MSKLAHRRTAGLIAALAATTLVAAGCSETKDAATSATSAAAGAASAATSAAAGAASAATDAAKSAVAGVTDKVKAADGSEVTLSGPIAAKYASLSADQRSDLGAPKTGDGSSGTSDSGVVYQQFDGGVITAVNDDAGTPAYITWGKIRDAWNVPRNADGEPSADGKGGSNGPLGAANSDETTDGDVRTSTFQHGTITWNSGTDTVTVTVNGKEVAAE